MGAHPDFDQRVIGWVNELRGQARQGKHAPQEFVSLEHTSKNKMILAVRRAAATGGREAEALARVAELKAFYGIREHCLEQVLRHGISLGVAGAGVEKDVSDA